MSVFKEVGETKPIISTFLDTNGDGTGTTIAIGDYSSAEEIFYIQPPADEIYRITRMIISVGDTSGMQAQEYGNLGSALTNGISVRVSNDGGVMYGLTNGIPIKDNAHWGSYCYDVDVKSWGSGNELLVSRWTFAQSGQHIRLNGGNNERLEVVLNDDFTGLLDQHFLVQGYKEDE